MCECKVGAELAGTGVPITQPKQRPRESSLVMVATIDLDIYTDVA